MSQSVPPFIHGPNSEDAWHCLGLLDELAGDTRHLREFEGRRVAVFRLDDRWVAIDNHCPHRGAPVAAGPWDGGCLTCPWHGWQFEMSTGRCLSGDADARLSHLPCQEREGALWVCLHRPVETSPPDSVQACQVPARYGRQGSIAWFQVPDDLPLGREDVVELQTPRGWELGTLVGRPTPPASAGRRRAVAGRVLQLATPELVTRWDAGQRICGELIAAVQERLHAAALEHIVVDAEVLLDDRVAIVYYMGEPSAALGPIAVAASADAAGRQVRMEGLRLNEVDGEESGSPSPAAVNDEVDEEDAMKGPYERLKYDMRRVWECPACQHRERSSGAVTSMFCRCQEQLPPQDRRCMRLVDNTGEPNH